MEKERIIKIIGITSIIYGIVFLFIFLGFFFNYYWLNKVIGQLFKTGIFHADILVWIFITFPICITYIVAGIGFLKHKDWARISLILLSIITFFSFPTGSIISVIFFIFLLNDEIKSLMK